VALGRDRNEVNKPDKSLGRKLQGAPAVHTRVLPRHVSRFVSSHFVESSSIGFLGWPLTDFAVSLQILRLHRLPAG
jgi:hypothetical protein